MSEEAALFYTQRVDNMGFGEAKTLKRMEQEALAYSQRGGGPEAR